MPAHYTRYNLADMLTDNKKGKIVLPNFQRDFIWDLEKQKRLLSTFLCSLPIGSFLVLEGKKDDFACKQLNYTSSDVDYIANECFFLLDGQQRLSSLSSFFSNLFGAPIEYDNHHDKLYSSLRNRWYIRLAPHDKENDVFGWETLNFNEINIYSYEPNDLIDFLGCFKVYKKDRKEWWHPAFQHHWETNSQDHFAKVRDKIAEEAAAQGILPLWDFFENPDRGIHDIVLRKIGERRKHAIEAKIIDGDNPKINYYNILKDIDYDVQSKIDAGEDIENLWMELRTNWKKNIITCIKNCINHDIPVVTLPSSEVSRAVATFSAVNEGGTKLDTYDLIVARAAKSRDQESLTKRINDIISQEISDMTGVFGNNVGSPPTSWSCKHFGVVEDNVPVSAFKDIFLNTLSVYNHHVIDRKELKVEHIKNKGILDLTHDKINNSTTECVEAIKKAFSFLVFRCGMKSLSDLNYKLMILPVTICFLQKDLFYNYRALNRIEYWFWLSLFAGRYRENQNEMCVYDIEALRKYVVNGDQQYFSSIESRILNYEGYSDRDLLLLKTGDNPPKAISSGIMNYILSQQPKDFCFDCRICSWDAQTGNEIRIGSESVKIELHNHHIMPLANERNINESTQMLRNNKSHILNSPLNRTFILSRCNNYLSHKSISEYLPKLSEAAAFHHCMPSDDFSYRMPGESDEDYYKRFLNARYDKLKAKINEELENLKN